MPHSLNQLSRRLLIVHILDIVPPTFILTLQSSFLHMLRNILSPSLQNLSFSIIFDDCVLLSLASHCANFINEFMGLSQPFLHCLVKATHLVQQLEQNPLLTVGTGLRAKLVCHDSVDFVDEDDSERVFARETHRAGCTISVRGNFERIQTRRRP